jgi:hypothetical protein
MLGARTAARRLALAATLSVAVLVSVAGSGVSAAGPTLRIQPGSVAVSKGTAFDVHIVQDASQAISGAQISLTFDPKVLQVARVAPGAGYADASVFLPSDMTAAIVVANQTGKLGTVAAAFVPPSSVPPGNRDFLVITLTAVGCGATRLGLPVGPADAVMLDGAAGTYGNTVGVATSEGAVSVDCGGSTTASSPAGAAARPSGGAPGASASISASTSAPTAAVPIGPQALAFLGVVALLVVLIVRGLLGRPRRAR